MHRRVRQFVVWMTLAQVGLVGGLGTGLHALFDCEHCTCSAACCDVTPTGGCSSCAFCRRNAEPAPEPGGFDAVSASCDGCVVCDLLWQFHNATPLTIGLPSIELADGEADLQRHNAVVAAMTRRAVSRGPPTA